MNFEGDAGSGHIKHQVCHAESFPEMEFIG